MTNAATTTSDGMTQRETRATIGFPCDELPPHLVALCCGDSPRFSARQCLAHANGWRAANGLPPLLEENAETIDPIQKSILGISPKRPNSPIQAIPLYIDRSTPCIHLGSELRIEGCKLCGQSGKTAAVHSCRIRGECTRDPAGLTVTGGKRLMTVCQSCKDHTAPADVAVVVLCHNYGRFLAECLESVLAQTQRPREIVIIDDDSTDETQTVAESFVSRGVRYVRVSVHNTHAGRAAGFRETTAPVVCFLDADDKLAPDYIAAGLPLFADASVAIVYSDMDQFGERTGRLTFPQPGDDLARENFMHAGSLVRRDALTMCRAFETEIPCDSSNDWFLWRRISADGWTAAKSPAFYLYRRHGLSQTYRRRGITYFDLANLQLEPVTLFLPLSGRRKWWPRLREWVDAQTWPHHLTRLVIADTSQDATFGREVRAWLAQSDYVDARYYAQDVGLPGLADENRRDPQFNRLVNEAMPRIYNRMMREATTEYVAVVEDDLRPPLDAIPRLMQSFDQKTAAVSGAYRSRFADGFVAWDTRFNHAKESEGVVDVHGSGFGCVIVRRSVLKDHVFTHAPPRRAYDYTVSDWIAERGHRFKLDWSVRCAHGELEG